jgi:hypothetical protein
MLRAAAAASRGDLQMMAFMTSLLRFFVAVGIALWIIAGGLLGWFYDALPRAAGQLDMATPVLAAGPPTLELRVVGAVVGCVVGLCLATLTFGILALLLDIRDRLVIIAENAQVGRRLPMDK